MKIIVLAGIPGSGKSTLRRVEYADVPYIDMADMHSSPSNLSHSWQEAMHLFFNEVFNHKERGTPLLIVEGIFATGSTSLRQLTGYCNSFDIDIEVRQLQAPLHLCLLRIIDDYVEDGDEQRLAARAYFAGKYRGGFV